MPGNELNAKQKAAMGQIARYGVAHGYTPGDIQVAAKTAWIESKLGKFPGPPAPTPENPHPTASGLFQYTDPSWNRRAAGKNDNAVQIREFYKDLSRYRKRYDEAPEDLRNNLDFGQFFYGKHKGGSRYQPGNGPGKKGDPKEIWEREDFTIPADLLNKTPAESGSDAQGLLPLVFDHSPAYDDGADEGVDDAEIADSVLGDVENKPPAKFAYVPSVPGSFASVEPSQQSQLLAAVLNSPTFDDDMTRFALQNASVPDTAQVAPAGSAAADDADQAVATQFGYSPTTAAYAKLLAGPPLIFDLK